MLESMRLICLHAQKSLLKEDIMNIRICYDQVDNPSAVLKTELAYLVESEFLGQFYSSKSDLTCVMFDTEEEGCLVFKAKNNQVTDVSFSGRGFYEDIIHGSFAYDKSSRSIVYQKDGMKIKPINVASGLQNRYQAMISSKN